MASTSISLCSLAVMVAAVGLFVYGYYHIFQQKRAGENDLEVIQKQIRGFALLMIANLVMIIGSMVCAGTFLPVLLAMLRE